MCLHPHLSFKLLSCPLTAERLTVDGMNAAGERLHCEALNKRSSMDRVPSRQVLPNPKAKTPGLMECEERERRVPIVSYETEPGERWSGDGGASQGAGFQCFLTTKKALRAVGGAFPPQNPSEFLLVCNWLTST